MRKTLERKRAPGAGRPRKAEADKKGSAFTTRITAETRRALEGSARKHRRSLSQEAEAGLRDYLKKPAGAARNRAIGAIVGNLAQGIEQQTGKSWRTDVFTSMALRYATDRKLRLAEAIFAKNEYNRNRADHSAEGRAAEHGKKF